MGPGAAVGLVAGPSYPSLFQMSAESGVPQGLSAGLLRVRHQDQSPGHFLVL